MKRWVRQVAVFCLFLLVGFVIYGKSLSNGFVIDDEDQLVNNTIIRSVSRWPELFAGSTFDSRGAGLTGTYYRPLPSLLRMLTYRVFELNPLPYHFTQLLFFIGLSFLLYIALAPLCGHIIALILSLLFLVHPINTESVVYISAAQDIMMAFFGMLAYVISQAKRDHFLSYVAIYGSLLLSLFSKETGVMFVVFIVLYRLLFFRKNIWFHVALSATMAAFYAYLRFVLAGLPLTKYGAAPIINASLTQRFLTIPSEITYYLQTLFFPLHMTFSHTFLVTSPTLENFVIPSLLVAVTIYLLIYILQKHIQFHATQRVWYLFFVFWVTLSLIMHLHIPIPLDMTVSDRWFLVPFIGLLGLASVILSSFHMRVATRRLLGISAVCILIILSIRSYKRSLDWRDGLTLYSHDIVYSPNNYDIQNDLAHALAQQGRYQEALPHAQASIALAPKYWGNWNTLGAILLRTGDVDGAIAAYRQSIQNSDYALSYQNLAATLLLYKSPSQAQEFIRLAVRKFPENDVLWADLAVSDYLLGYKSEALVAASRAYVLLPSDQNRKLRERIEANLPLDIQSK